MTGEMEIPHCVHNDGHFWFLDERDGKLMSVFCAICSFEAVEKPMVTFGRYKLPWGTILERGSIARADKINMMKEVEWWRRDEFWDSIANAK